MQMGAEQNNHQLGMLALGVKTSRYYVNTSTDQAERAALMVYVAAKKTRDELWQLISGNVLAGISLLSRLSWFTGVVDGRCLWETG